jgi:hypothetical protein
MTATNRCGTCREELPHGASFCPVCGAATELETCRIVLWRGYEKSGFYALRSSSRGDAMEEPLGSPLFRTKGSQPPAEKGSAQNAHATLVERLLTEGWELAGRGPRWYSEIFVRRPEEPLAEAMSVPVQSTPPTPAPAPAEAVPEAQPDTSEWRETESVRVRSKRRMRIGGVFLVAAVVGVTIAVAPSLMSSQAAKGDLPAVKAAKKVAKQEPKAKPSHPIARRTAIERRTARVANVVLAATRGDSWVEARAGSSTGRLLYTGVLVQGQKERVSAGRVWLRLAAAGHLDVLVNGRPPREAPLFGTLDIILGPGSGS